MKKVSNEVYVSADTYPTADRAALHVLSEALQASINGRIRLCTHKDGQDPLHEMFIVFSGNNYVMPAKHLDKDESLLLIEGEADYAFFDGIGNIINSIPLGAYGQADRQFFCRIPSGTEHSLLVTSSRLIAKETTTGPFNRADTFFSTWAPTETDAPGIAAFMRNTEMQKPFNNSLPLLTHAQDMGNILYPSEPLLSMGMQEITFLKHRATASPHKYSRLSMTPDASQKLQEHFSVYQQDSQMQPRKNTRHDTSIHILEGMAEITVFNDTGEVKERFNLGDMGSEHPFYIRIPLNTLYAIAPGTGTLVTHEAISSAPQSDQQTGNH